MCVHHNGSLRPEDIKSWDDPEESSRALISARGPDVHPGQDGQSLPPLAGAEQVRPPHLPIRVKPLPDPRDHGRVQTSSSSPPRPWCRSTSMTRHRHIASPTASCRECEGDIIKASPPTIVCISTLAWSGYCRVSAPSEILPAPTAWYTSASREKRVEYRDGQSAKRATRMVQVVARPRLRKIGVPSRSMARLPTGPQLPHAPWGVVPQRDGSRSAARPGRPARYIPRARRAWTASAARTLTFSRRADGVPPVCLWSAAGYRAVHRVRGWLARGCHRGQRPGTIARITGRAGGLLVNLGHRHHIAPGDRSPSW